LKWDGVATITLLLSAKALEGAFKWRMSPRTGEKEAKLNRRIIRVVQIFLYDFIRLKICIICFTGQSIYLYPVNGLMAIGIIAILNPFLMDTSDHILTIS